MWIIHTGPGMHSFHMEKLHTDSLHAAFHIVTGCVMASVAIYERK